MTENTYPAHHGIKGMKWGVRRTPEQLGHNPKSPSKGDLKKAYKAERKAANAQYRQTRGESVDRWERDEARNRKRADSSYTDDEKRILQRGKAFENLSKSGESGSVGQAVGAAAYATHQFRNRDLYKRKASVDAKLAAANDRASERHSERMKKAIDERTIARNTAKENYKSAVAKAKAQDQANYSDYKKAAASYKSHATRGERVVGALMGNSTAYYAQRQRGMTRGQASVDVFMKGNMGALNAYGVRLNARRILAN